MRTQTISVTAQPREKRGTAEAARLRREGFLPGIVYSEGKPARMIKMNLHDFEVLLRHHTSESLIMELSIEGETKPRRVLLRDVQHEPIGGHVLHIDFYEVSATKKLHLPIPIEIAGNASGVKKGGVLEHHLHSIEVECLADDVVESFTVDVSDMEIGDSRNVDDLEIDRKRYHVLIPGDVAVVAVAAPRVLAEAEEEEGEAAAVEAGEGAEAEAAAEES